MTTFVLVHDLSLGGWVWRAVARLLRSAGHEVYAPSLTGMGERTHLLTPTCGLQHHILDIANLLDYEDLNDVALVGHGYGGMVGSGVTALKATRVGHVVHLDAPVPTAGDTLLALLPDTSALLAPQRIEGGWRVEPPPSSYWGVVDPAIAAWMRPRLSPFALATCTEPIGTPGATIRPRRSYLWSEESSGHAGRAIQLQALGGWEVLQVQSGFPLLDPAGIAGALGEIAK